MVSDKRIYPCRLSSPLGSPPHGSPRALLLGDPQLAPGPQHAGDASGIQVLTGPNPGTASLQSHGGFFVGFFRWFPIGFWRFFGGFWRFLEGFSLVSHRKKRCFLEVCHRVSRFSPIEKLCFIYLLPAKKTRKRFGFFGGPMMTLAKSRN